MPRLHRRAELLSLASASATEGQSFSGTIATVSDAYSSTSMPATDLAATITWDDGTHSSGTVTAGGSGSYIITATHTFHLVPDARLQRCRHRPGGGKATASGGCHRWHAGLSGSLATINATEVRWRSTARWRPSPTATPPPHHRQRTSLPPLPGIAARPAPCTIAARWAAGNSPSRAPTRSIGPASNRSAC